MANICSHRGIFLLLLVTSPTLVSGIFFRYGKTNQSKAFRIPIENIELESKRVAIPNMSKNTPYFKNISARYTTDERCLNGMPLGLAFLAYEPYAAYVPHPRTFPPPGLEFFSIFPDLLKKALVKCCHPNSTVSFAKLLSSQTVTTDDTDYDLYLPLYGNSMDDTKYNDNPFVPVLQAPTIALLVYSDDIKKGNTHLIIMTILKKFPLLVFIMLTASASGIFAWFLDHRQNEVEFSKNFMKGAWEGFWWAFITMTTVGYGDRTPKTILGRIFCFIWIIFGIVTFSIFSGLITANLYASTQRHFEIRGAKIGAVGSKEFKLGVSLNAKMSHFPNSPNAFGKLLNKELDGMLVDNYAATYFGKKIASHNIRRDRMIDHPITYGIMLGKNTSYLEKCIRKYFMDNPQEVFEIVRNTLHPKKNKADSENLRLKEATKLFYQDETFKKIIEIEAIVLGVLLALGICYQFLCYLWKRRKLDNKKSEDYSHQLVKGSKWRLGSFKNVNSPVDDLIEQYKSFENGWTSRLKSLQPPVQND